MHSGQDAGCPIFAQSHRAKVGIRAEARTVFLLPTPKLRQPPKARADYTIHRSLPISRRHPERSEGSPHLLLRLRLQVRLRLQLPLLVLRRHPRAQRRTPVFVVAVQNSPSPEQQRDQTAKPDPPHPRILDTPATIKTEEKKARPRVGLFHCVLQSHRSTKLSILFRRL
jgi:hypothetical protein